MFNNKDFYTLVAGLLFFVVKFYAPEFPLDEAGMLKSILFVLGVFGVGVPSARYAGIIK